MLPLTKQERKERPIDRGCLQYFPDALAYVSHVSFVGNEQHNPGQPMHWAREKSSDHGDCVVRHQADAGTLDDDGLLHSGKVAWRALAQLQLELEDRYADTLDLSLTASEAVKVESRRATGAAETTLSHGTAVSCPDCPTPDACAIGGTKPCERGPRPRVYVAGPMRGIKDFNFPAFDKARNRLLNFGWDVISPADLDRRAATQASTDAEAGSEERVHEYMDRDLTDTLLTFRRSRGDAIAMLPGWEKSAGATTEFMVARWAGLIVLDARSGSKLTHVDCDALGRAVTDFL